MATNAMMTCQYKWPSNKLNVYPMKLKYELEDSLWNSEWIGVVIDA